MNRKITFLLALLLLGFCIPSFGAASPITGANFLCQGASTPLSDADPGGTWTSSVTTVATVDGLGDVFGVGPGTSVITYSSVLGTATFTVTVGGNPVANVTGPNTLCQGTTITLSDATAGGTWSTATTSIISVSSATGVVTGVAGGVDAVTYTTACGIVYYNISVTSTPTAISGSATVCSTFVITLSESVTGGTWSTNNSTVATVVSGTVYGGTPGAAVITYSNGCGSPTFNITVNQTPTAIIGLNSFCQGSTSVLTSTPAGGVWSSSNTAIATINSGTGVMTGNVGSAVITYTLGDGCYSLLAVTVANCPACPINSDFELGDYSYWHYYAGTCCPITTGTTCTVPPSGPAPCAVCNRFALTGPCGAPSVCVCGNDPYGGFPVVGAGVYSLRLGTCESLYHASKAVYFVHVPAIVGTYALIYRYAVVLQDPNHSAPSQPRFTVQAFDSNSGSTVPLACANFNYVAGSLPGFVGPVGLPAGATCSPSGGGGVYYKPWSTTSINLTGLGGHTIRMEFAAGDCGLGGHWGYGYIDMTCGTFAIGSIGCGDSIATVTAPSGFASYSWYDSTTFTTLYGTTQTVTFPMPTVPTTYAVIMAPYPGFGCPDTLYTHVRPSNLQVHPHVDTSICVGQSTPISSGATDVALPLSYSWTPTTTLSCATCATPIATPLAGVNIYTVVVTDDAGCQLSTTQKVTVDSVAAITGSTPTRCFGFADGTATVTPTSGAYATPPYSYSWVTTPLQTTSVAIGLPVGTYSVTVTDSKGCNATTTATITQPPILTMSIGGTTNPTTCGGHDGTITLNGLVPSTNMTVRYLYTATATTTTVAVTQTYPVSAGGSLVITGLPGAGMAQGTYDSITIVTAGCPYNELGPIVLTDPPNPALPYVSSNSPVCVGKELDLTTTDVTPGVTYNWSGPNTFSSTSQTPTRVPAVFADSGWYIVTVMVNNCFSKDSTHVIINDTTHPAAANNSAICSGDTLKLYGSITSGGADLYVWNGPNGFASNSQNPWILNTPPAGDGIYTLTVTYHGCSAMATTSVVVNPTPPPPGITDTNYCQFASPVPALSATGTNLLWYTPPSLIGIATAPTPTTSIPGITTWYVTQTSAEGCLSPKAAVSVGIYAYPNPKFNVTDSVYCEGTYFTFGVDDAVTGPDYQGLTWYFATPDSIQNTNPVIHAFSAAGTTTVTVNVYYKVCPDTVMKHVIKIYPYPSVHLGNDTTICPGGEALHIGDDENATGATWLWSTGETTSHINIVAPGIYYTKVTINGCTTTDTIHVLNDCYMNIPNVFSPNGDGVNDYFYPRQLLTRGLTSFSMNIYNRWGQLVFQTTSLDGRGWDGKFNDVPQPEGVFVYVIDATFKDGQKEHHQGNITLIR